MTVLSRSWRMVSALLTFLCLMVFSSYAEADNAMMVNLRPGCPPNGYKKTQPPLDFDADGDGTNDSWWCEFDIIDAAGNVYSKGDEQGNNLFIPAIADTPPGDEEDHYLPQFLKAEQPIGKGAEVGRCVWPCGRNSWRICFEDKNKDLIPDRFTKSVWESRDGGKRKGDWKFTGRIATAVTDLLKEKVVPVWTYRKIPFGACEYEIVDATVVDLGADLPFGFPNGDEGMWQDGVRGSPFAHDLVVTTADPCIGKTVQALGTITNYGSTSHSYEVVFFAVNGSMNHGARTLSLGPGETGTYSAGATVAAAGDGAIVAFAYTETCDDADGITAADVFSARDCGGGGGGPISGWSVVLIGFLLLFVGSLSVRRQALGALAVFVLVGGTALAQTPSKYWRLPDPRPGVDGSSGGGVPLGGENLYCDPCNSAIYGFIAQEFPDYSSWSTHTMDDFTVPDGETWNITDLHLDGFYNCSPIPPGCPNGSLYGGSDYYFVIYASDPGTGLPDCNPPICEARPNQGAPGMTDGPNCWGYPRGGLDYDIEPDVLWTLTGGTYWFAGGVNMTFYSPTACWQWYWIGSTAPHRNGNVAWFANFGGGFGCGTDWIAWTDPCLGIDQDQSFWLTGTRGDVWDVCAARAGNTDVGPGGGGIPADVVTIDGSAGDSCRELTVSAGGSTTLAIDAAPSETKSHYALWIYAGENVGADETVIDLTTNKGAYYVLGTPGGSAAIGNQGGGARCLPINNITNPGSCPCDVTFPVGRTSKKLGSGIAALLCLNKKPGYPKAPTTFSQTFPGGDYMVGAIIQDANAFNSPYKSMSVTNWIVVHAW